MKGGSGWFAVETFDDIILPTEKEIISDLEKEAKTRCPHLKKEGKFFYYCGLSMLEVVNKGVDYSNPIYKNHIDVVEMQFYCMAEFEKCSNYK